MTSHRQHPWHNSASQQVLLEYAALKQSCPTGVYVTIQPGDPLQWSGVLFVRKGPYSPAILRFHVQFPLDYPSSAPTIIFRTDVFHPLVTPLTTYTYSTGSTGTDAVSASDPERLPPGSFSLQHGFPNWFARQSSRSGSEVAKKDGAESIGHSSPSESPTKGIAARNSLDGSDATDVQSKSTKVQPDTVKQHDNITILQIFEYIRRSFSESDFLDAVPIEAAGNTGAWRAWRAHRVVEGIHFDDALQTAKVADQGTEWNWDGVWDQRVRKGVDLSVSDSVLFGTAAGEDIPRFHDLDEDMLQQIRSQVLYS